MPNEKFFLAKIEEAKAVLKEWEAAYAAYLKATKAEMKRTRWPDSQGRQNVALSIKEALAKTPTRTNFTASELFHAMKRNDLDYERTRPSIVSWLRYYVEEDIIQKVDRGVYRIPRKYNFTKED